jgi:hypothetical protein
MYVFIIDFITEEIEKKVGGEMMGGAMSNFGKI